MYSCTTHICRGPGTLIVVSAIDVNNLCLLYSEQTLLTDQFLMLFLMLLLLILSCVLQVDIASDGLVDWDEFCTYLMLQFEENDQASKVSGSTFVPKPNIVRIDHNKV